MVSPTSHSLNVQSRRKHNQMLSSLLMLANLPLPALSPSPIGISIPDFSLEADWMKEESGLCFIIIKLYLRGDKNPSNKNFVIEENF